MPFALFLGAAMSITAFPVLAAILRHRGIDRTPLGALVMASAAGDDLLTWATLALVVGITTASTPFASLLVVGATGGLGLALAVFVRPALARLRDRRLDATLLSMSLAGLLLCSSLTAAFGAHEIFGAFLFGALFPRGRLSEQLSDELEVLSGALLPVFFLTTGLQVGLRDVHRSGAADLVLLLVVACAGKVLGAAGASRSLGLRTREALAVGVLMNTRGLTELVVLHVGLTMACWTGTSSRCSFSWRWRRPPPPRRSSASSGRTRGWQDRAYRERLDGAVRCGGVRAGRLRTATRRLCEG